MADIFISYTSVDRDWAFWIAEVLKELGHTPHIHDWEIEGGVDIYAWMERRHDAADHVLCVISDEYLRAPYATLERNAALWRAASRPGFVIFVMVRPCRLPTLADHIRRCELFGISEPEARQRFTEFMAKRATPAAIAFPATAIAVSNIPIRVPVHFMGREEQLAKISAALKRYQGRVAITALHGLRGVGKTTLAAAYAEAHRDEYRATWWIRAQTVSSIRTDLIALGVRLGWVGAEEKEEPALAAVMERLRHEGDGILLIFDNAADAESLRPYLPRGGACRMLVTSNAHAWRGVAEPVHVRLWPAAIGADYLIVRTGEEGARAAAEALSEVLGGLPLAHEQAAAYCERLDIPLAEYHRRFAAAPVRLLADARHAPAEYHDGLTVAKTFALAIEEASKLDVAAEPLIAHAALLAPEPIPLFLFTEGREAFDEPLSSGLHEQRLDEAIAALRAFALIDRERIVDERDPSVATPTIRLHRLVREVAAERRDGEGRDAVRRSLIKAAARVYPMEVFDDPQAWIRARRLDTLALALVGPDAELPSGMEERAGYLLNGLAAYRHGALGAYREARPLRQRSLMLREKALGPRHPDTAESLNNLALTLQEQGELAQAQPLHERALSIREQALGSMHPDTGVSLNNLALLLQAKGDPSGGVPLLERALTINEAAYGPEHFNTARTLNNLGFLMHLKGEMARARRLHERALAIREKTLGADHPHTASSLNNLALVIRDEGDLAAARPLFERALAIREKTLGLEHPQTAATLNYLALLLQAAGELAEAQTLFQRALSIRQRVLGSEHPSTVQSLANLALLLQAQGDIERARPLLERALAACDRVLGPVHADTVKVRQGLGISDGSAPRG